MVEWISIDCEIVGDRLMSVGGVIAYVLLLGAGFGAAMGLYFGLRAVKLI